MSRPALFPAGPPGAAGAAGPRERQGPRRSAAAVLGAITAFGSGALTPMAPGVTMPGTTGPTDRIGVAIPPVYPPAPPGFLRLPETQSLPVGSTAAPSQGGPPPPAPGVPSDRPVWSPARLEPVVGIDAQGRVRTILESTPGRFER